MKGTDYGEPDGIEGNYPMPTEEEEKERKGTIDEREFRRDTLNCEECELFDQVHDSCKSSECVYFIKSKKEMIDRITNELCEVEADFDLGKSDFTDCIDTIAVRVKSALIVANQLTDELALEAVK